MELDQRSHKGFSGIGNEMQIQQLLATWQEAMHAKDARRVASCYAADAVMFALAPPLSSVGMNEQALQAWFDTWKVGPTHEEREVELAAGDDIAHCHSLSHMSGTKTSGEQVDLWFRVTVCLRRIEGEWKVTHEHASVPFKMDGSMRAAVDLRPQ